MDVKLSWDLVLVCAFFLIFAYNYMLGQRGTVKLIICIYIATLAADGIAGILKEYIFDPSGGVQNIIGEKETELFSWMRMGIFLFFITMFVVKSGFHIHLGKHDHWAVRAGIHGGFSALGAILFLCVLMIYLAGLSFVEGMLYAKRFNIYESSVIARTLVDFVRVWFALPAIAFLVTSFFFDDREKEQ